MNFTESVIQGFEEGLQKLHYELLKESVMNYILEHGYIDNETLKGIYTITETSVRELSPLFAKTFFESSYFIDLIEDTVGIDNYENIPQNGIPSVDSLPSEDDIDVTNQSGAIASDTDDSESNDPDELAKKDELNDSELKESTEIIDKLFDKLGI